MDKSLLPKTLSLFLDDLYKEFPVIKTHPDYNFYYLYYDSPNTNEYLFCLVHDFLYNSKFADDLNYSMNNKCGFYNFTNATIINYNDLIIFEKNIKDLISELKKTDNTVLFYPVW